jgi:hypothetical protein
MSYVEVALRGVEADGVAGEFAVACDGCGRASKIGHVGAVDPSIAARVAGDAREGSSSV